MDNTIVTGVVVNVSESIHAPRSVKPQQPNKRTKSQLNATDLKEAIHQRIEDDKIEKAKKEKEELEKHMQSLQEEEERRRANRIMWKKEIEKTIDDVTKWSISDKSTGTLSCHLKIVNYENIESLLKHLIDECCNERTSTKDKMTHSPLFTSKYEDWTGPGAYQGPVTSYTTGCFVSIVSTKEEEETV